jgi:hypothetical protein
MKVDQYYCVALFDTVSHVMKAEKVLKSAGIPHKLIPVPRSISSDCGVCLRFLPEQKEAVIKALTSTTHVREIREFLP